MRLRSAFGKSVARPFMTVVISLLARSNDAPCLRRMKPSCPWLTSLDGVRWANHRSAPCGMSKSRGATPEMVVLNSAKWIGLPTTAGSLLYICFHRRVEITTAGSGPCCGGPFGCGWNGVKSSCLKPPMVMGRPNSSKKPSLTANTCTCDGVPSAARSVRSPAWTPAARSMASFGSLSRKISPPESSPVVTRPSVRAVRRL